MKFTNPQKANLKLMTEAVHWLMFRHPEMADFSRIVAFIVRVLWRFSSDEEYFSDWIRELEVRASVYGIPLVYYLSFVATSLLSCAPKSTCQVTPSKKSGGKHVKR
jgi:hypothetical protein